ncbi:MAG TPA: hypothetical protein VGQ91_06030 [Ideonella sp.]|jgi:hypothetical protein|nr:hypothetical protein [Ideonella sp.]
MFRSLLVTAAACAAFSSLSAAGAAADAEQVRIRVERPLSRSDFADLRGDFDLSNGGRLSIEGTSRHPVAQIDRQAPMALVKIGPNRYADAAGTARIDAQTGADGIVSSLTLTFMPHGTVLAAVRP